jgi:serine/threonine protein kinase
VGLIGNGAFAYLDLVEHKPTGKTYVLKTMSKGYIEKIGMQDNLMVERMVLLTVRSPFVARLYEAYNGDQYVYFLLEACLGGELYDTYKRKSLHGNEVLAKYYVAGVAVALEHLHAHNIVYRDMKPENVVLTDQGHPKLVDMGLAKFVMGGKKTFTTCGTPDYFAPELIQSTGHTHAVDWWTLGILLFELLAGKPPFEAAAPMQIYAKIMKGIDKVPMPPKCKGPPGNLIKALLQMNPTARLPMRPGGTKNLKDHNLFKDFDWMALENGTMEAPYKPAVESARDITNFPNVRKEDMPKSINYQDNGTGWDTGFAVSAGD